MSSVDWLILVIYIVFVIGIGFYLRRFTRTDEDFFLAGRRNSAWVAGVAFMSANMGAMEVIGYTGMAVKYGMHCAHFYLISAIPAMVILGLFMMPFYYSGRIKSIPGYLKERFDEKTRVLNALIFSIMMVLVSGISLYLLAMIMKQVVGWDWQLCVWVAAALVALYVSLAGLMSAIFTEVIQFFLIWAGILILPVLGFIELGPEEVWNRVSQMLTMSQSHAEIDPNTMSFVDGVPTLMSEAGGYVSIWSSTVDPGLNPMQVTWMSLILGIGFAIGFGYWTTDFLIIQRAFSARDTRSARLTPIIGSYFKILLGVVCVSTGLITLTLIHRTEERTDPAASADTATAGGENEQFRPFKLLIDVEEDPQKQKDLEIVVRDGHQLHLYREKVEQGSGADEKAPLYFEKGEEGEWEKVVLAGGEKAKVRVRKKINYDSALPLMMARYFPVGMIGLGITAIIAMLCAGQAGNMSAFAAVWTYDLYQAIFRKKSSQAELLVMGRVATVCGLLLAVAGAYLARSMPTVIDYLQAIASMILAPGVAIILPGMFIKRMTPHGAFWGMLVGCVASFGMFLVQQLGLVDYSYFTPVQGSGFMAANFWRSVWAWLIAFGVAITISLFTNPRTDEELKGLVWGTAKIKHEEKVGWHRTPWFWASVAMLLFVALNVIFW